MGFWDDHGFVPLFSEERTVSGRQLELDIVRGLSVFLMVGAHIFNQFAPLSEGDVPQEPGFFDWISRLIGAFPGGAQCFMMVMGMLLLFSSTATCRNLMKRGCILIVAGFGVEVIRIIPELINLALTGTMISYFPEYTGATDTQLLILTLFWQDILVFAGMALIFLGAMQKFGVSDRMLVLIVGAMMVANVFLAGMNTGNDAVDIALGYFWGTTIFEDVVTASGATMTTSRFPFFSWIIFPVVGYLIAKYMVRTKDKDAFYRRLAHWALFVFTVSSTAAVALYLITGYDMFYNGFTGMMFYHQTVLINIWCASTSVLWIIFIAKVVKKVDRKYLSPFERWSRNITIIYIVHFGVVAVITQLMPKSLNIIGCSIVFLLVFAFVDWLAEMVAKRKAARASA